MHLSNCINNFCDLPREMIYEIYIRDSTYKDIYNKIVKIINNFPCFTRIDTNYYIFTKNITLHNISYRDDYRVSTNYSYKKSLIIIIKKFTKPHTLVKNV